MLMSRSKDGHKNGVRFRCIVKQREYDARNKRKMGLIYTANKRERKLDALATTQD